MSKLASAFALICICAFGLFGFGPEEWLPTTAGEELTIFPIVCLASVLVAIVGSLRAPIRRFWQYTGLVLSAVAVLLWAGYAGLMLLAYRECPNGVC